MAIFEKDLQRFSKAKKRKTNWTEHYRDCLTYVAPHRESFDADEPGTAKDSKGLVYDSTAIDAGSKFVSNLQSSLLPPMRNWIGFQPGPQVKDNESVKKTLSDIEDLMFAGIRNSNFDTQISESFYDLLIGTGSLLVQKGTKEAPFRFISVPLSEIVLEEGIDGRPDATWREWKLPVRNIEQTWSDAKLSKELKEKLAEKPDDRVCIVEGTVPEKVKITTPGGTKEVDGYRYFVMDVDNKSYIVEREMATSPWVIFRWEALPGEIYGRGPALKALPDIKTLNKTKELLLKNASINVAGIWQADDDGVINMENIKLVPGTVIPKATNSKGLQPLNTGGDVNLAQIVINDLRNAINNMFFADPLGPIDAPVKTATELSLRQNELAKRIGSAFGRLQYELLKPLVNRLLSILDELDLIDIGDFKVDGNIIDIQHVSPLARAQDEEDVTAIMRYLELIAGFYGPETLQIAAPVDKVVAAITPKLKLPEAMVPTQAEFDQAKQAAVQVLNQQAAMGNVSG